MNRKNIQAAAVDAVAWGVQSPPAAPGKRKKTIKDEADPIMSIKINIITSAKANSKANLKPIRHRIFREQAGNPAWRLPSLTYNRLSFLCQ